MPRYDVHTAELGEAFSRNDQSVAWFATFSEKVVCLDIMSSQIEFQQDKVQWSAGISSLAVHNFHWHSTPITLYSI